MTQKIKILIVDDEPGIRKLVADILSDDYITCSAGSTAEALSLVPLEKPALVISDVKMPGPDGLALLENMGSLHGNIPVILMTGHGDKELVVKALRNNAFDYIEKPFEDEELLNTVQRAIDQVQLAKDLVSAQANMIHSSKMASLGLMAGGIAHEVNNPLATIGILAEQILRLVQHDPIDKTKISNKVETVSAMVFRISSIVNGLRTFSRDSSSDKFELVSVQRIMEDTIQLCSDSFKHKDVQLIFEEASQDITLECRPSQISQVVLNLLNNAVDAVTTLPEKWVRLSVQQIQNDIFITVTDSGSGISELAQQRLFQPFFTTKEVGKGTGLGLSISKGLIDGHGGTISIDKSSPNTCFLVCLPQKQTRVKAA